MGAEKLDLLDVAGDIENKLLDQLAYDLDRYLPSGWRPASEKDLTGYDVDDTVIAAVGPDDKLYMIESGFFSVIEIEKSTGDGNEPPAEIPGQLGLDGTVAA